MQQEMTILTFSFIIPTFNRRRLVKRAIESVLSSKKNNSIQTEIIVIDDGSHDGTESELTSYINDKSINFIKNQKNSGANTSRNNGIKIATSDYCVFLDSDDILDEDALIFMYEHFLKHSNNHLLFMASSLWNKKSPCYFRRNSDFYTLNEITLGYVKGDFLPIVKTSAIRNHLFFDGISGFEGSVWIWLTLDGYQPFYTDKIGRTIEYLTDGLSIASQLYKRVDTLAIGYDKSLRLFGLELSRECPKLYENFYLRFIFYRKLASTKNLSSPLLLKKTMKLVLAELALLFLPRRILLRTWNYKNKLLGV